MGKTLYRFQIVFKLPFSPFRQSDCLGEIVQIIKLRLQRVKQQPYERKHKGQRVNKQNDKRHREHHFFAGAFLIERAFCFYFCTHNVLPLKIPRRLLY